jgi:hypothetical protein
MPPRTRRSGITIPIPSGADENSDLTRNTMHTRGFGQEQVNPGVSAAGTRPARKLPVLLEL